jgi:hypothetical protein
MTTCFFVDFCWPSVDVYSFGTILWEIVTRHFTGKYSAPYSEIPNVRHIRKKVMNGEHPTIPSQCNEHVAQLLLDVTIYLLFQNMLTFVDFCKVLESGVCAETYLSWCYCEIAVCLWKIVVWACCLVNESQSNLDSSLNSKKINVELLIVDMNHLHQYNKVKEEISKNFPHLTW